MPWLIFWAASFSYLTHVTRTTIVVILLLNLLAIWVVQRYSPNRGYRLVREKWTLLLNLKEPVEWLVLGDSSGNQAVDPALLDARLGGRSLNLCTTGNALVLGDLWMLETYLRRFGPPRGVVLVHTYDLWGRDKNSNTVADVPLPWGYWTEREHPLHLGTEELMDLFLHPLLDYMMDYLMLFLTMVVW